MNFNIKQFEHYREGNRLEVKRAKGGLPGSLWESYSAFANSSGGLIILGIDEKSDGSFEPSGLKDVERLKKDFWNTINNQNKVSVNLLSEDDLKCYEINGSVILSVSVPRANREFKPVYINGDIWNGSYRRNGEGDYHCSKNEVRAMLRDQVEETADMKVLSDMAISDLNTETVHTYRSRHVAYRAEHVWSNLSDEVYLERIGAARVAREDNQLHPTAAGLLMFGEEYKILYEFPEFFLDFRETLDASIRWTDRVQSSSGDWTGNLFDFFFRVYPKLVRDLKIPFQLNGIIRVDETPVHRVLREAFANCLINADYYQTRGVVITKDAQKIVFENPGNIRLGKQQMIKGGISDPRNKALMKMFNLIGIGERAGSGVPDLFEVWQQYADELPIINERFEPDRTIVSLTLGKLLLTQTATQSSPNPTQTATQTRPNPTQTATQSSLNPTQTATQSSSHPTQTATQTSLNPTQSATQSSLDPTQTATQSSPNPTQTATQSELPLTEQEACVVEILKAHPQYSRADIADALGWKRDLVGYYLQRLKGKGVIARMGSNRKGYWVVKS